jgi:transcriptional regulator with XRE-family HTH domain
MPDYRKYACDLSGKLFKDINKKGVRREKLAKELNISENQIKNYAYDSTKSATLENFLHVLITYRCETVLDHLAKDMGYSIFKLPEIQQSAITHTDSAAEVLASAAAAVGGGLKESDRDEKVRLIRRAIEKLLVFEKTV